MTVAGCIAHCAALGHPIAGVEYVRECDCGSAFVNGGGAVLPDSACVMACSGDATGVCGGPGALSCVPDYECIWICGGEAGVQAERVVRRVTMAVWLQVAVTIPQWQKVTSS